MAFTNPSIAEFKLYFERDFPYSALPADGVTDNDIAKAMQVANPNINQCFFADQSIYNVGYLLLTAHNLVLSIQRSGQGLFGTGNAGIEQSKSVGSVSQSFAIPDEYMKNPTFAAFSKTAYGAEYFNLIYPHLVGSMSFAWGRTLP